MRAAAVGWIEEREPALVREIDGTIIKIIAPDPMTEQEKKMRHDAVIKAVADCIRATQQKPTA